MGRINGWFGVLWMLAALTVGGCATAGEGAGAEPTLTPQEAEGKRLLATYCVSCHSTASDVVVVGPSLAGMAGTAAGRTERHDAEGYLRESIEDPGAYVVEGFEDLMPESLSKSLTDEQIDAVVAYLMTMD